MTNDDIVQIYQLLGLYGHLIDSRDWGRLAEIFTPDVIFDASDLHHRVEGLPAVQAMMDDPRAPHPLAHHITNPYVWQEPDGTVHARSKLVGVIAEARVGTGTYFDTLVATEAGWRIAHREFRLRRESAMLRDLPKYKPL